MKIACLLAAGLALASSAAVVRADSNPTQNDVKALNYALQLEHLEAAFYAKGLGQFTDNSAFPTGVRDYLVLIGAHEAAHVDILDNAITASAANGGYGAQAGAACSAYSFSGESGDFTNVATFLSKAIELEDIGVSAYVAALNHLTNPAVQQVAATIATIEARHAAFLRNAVGTQEAGTKNPFPEAVNQARLPAQVLPLASPYLTTCSYNISANVPAVRPAGVALGEKVPTVTGSVITNAAASSATPSSNPTYSQGQFDADMDVLRYALTLEYLEADFYQTFRNKFNAEQFSAVSTVGTGNGANVVSNIDMIRAHEVAHVSAIQGFLQARGATIPQPGCYNWSAITDAATFLQVAAALENTGVSAYDGAANGLTDTGLQQVAAAVAVVEARHAAYLNNLNGQAATNQTYMMGNRDNARTKTDIVTAVSSLPYVSGALTNCANNRANTGSSQSFIIFDTTSSSSTGGPNGGSSTAVPNGGSSSSTGPNGSGNSASFAVPAFATAILAFASALLF